LAEEKLKTDPADPVANGILGRRRCFEQGDWQGGLPLLERGDDLPMQLAAAREKGMKSPAEILATADAWWEVGGHQTGTVRLMARQRARRFYEQAFSASAEADRTRAQGRLLELTNTHEGDGKTYRDDPGQLAALLGPQRSAAAKALLFDKFYLRTDNPKLKRIYGVLRGNMRETEHLRVRLRMLCRDERGEARVLESWKTLKPSGKGDGSIRITGPDVESVKAVNAGAWCPRNAHLAVFIDEVMIWQGLWQIPESSCWWLEEGLIVR
jgi:hypothetical protein